MRQEQQGRRNSEQGWGTAALVSVAHTTAMLYTGLVAAWVVVYRYLGLRVLNRAWLNLDTVWGASLVIAGGASVAMVALGVPPRSRDRRCTVGGVQSACRSGAHRCPV